MYRGRSVAVVVPAYNERSHIAGVLSTIPDFVDRVYAVDDRSTDGTWEIIRSMTGGPSTEAEAPPTEQAQPASIPAAGAEYPSLADGGTISDPRIVPIRHARNAGAGAALRTGYLRALADRLDIVVTMDADGQMDPDQLPKLLDPIVEDRADYAKGNRLASRDDRSGMPSFRLFGNSLLTMLTKVSSGYWGIKDPQNGYTAISHGALARIDIASIPDGHDYTNDVLVRLNTCALRIADVPMPAVYDDEQSTICYRSFVPKTSVTLLRGFLRRQYRRYLVGRVSPIPVLYAIGTIGILAVLIGTVIDGLPVSGTTPALATLAGAFIVALVSLVLAVVLDARANAGLEVTG